MQIYAAYYIVIVANDKIYIHAIEIHDNEQYLNVFSWWDNNN